MSEFTYTSLADCQTNIHALIQSISEASETGCTVTIAPLDAATWEQRKRLNAMCGDISNQIRLTPEGGYLHVTQAPFGRRLSKDAWRGIFMAILFGQQSVPNPDGEGFVVMSRSSKKLSKRQFSDAMELMSAFASQRRVCWTDPKWANYEQGNK